MAVMAENQIWKDLLAKGATSIEAAGIMGNMQYESSFDPEAIGDQGIPGGPSFGLVQEFGGKYQYLVTGKTSADEQRQLKLLKQQGGFRDASGTSASQAGANFAIQFERCRDCQMGTTETNRRAAAAQQIYNDAKSGNWPQANANNASTNAGTTAQSSSNTSTSGGCSFIDWINPLKIPGCIAQGIGSSITGRIEATFGNTIKDILVRMGLILLGGILIIVGIIVLTRASSEAKQIILAKEPAANATQVVSE